MSSRRRIVFRPAAARECDNVESEGQGAGPAEVERSSRPSSSPLGGIEAAAASDYRRARREHAQEAGPSETDTDLRRIRQRIGRQQPHLVEDPQAEPRREARKRSVTRRPQDEQRKDQTETERRRQQKQNVKNHIKRIYDRWNDPWLRVEELEARRSPLLKIDPTSPRYNFQCQELIKQYSRAIDEGDLAIQAQSQAVRERMRGEFEAPGALAAEQRHSPARGTVGHSTAVLNRAERRHSPESAAAAAARAESFGYRQAAVGSGSGIEWPGSTRYDIRSSQSAARQSEYPLSRSRDPLSRPQYQRAPIPSINDPRVRACAVSELRSILGQSEHNTSPGSPAPGNPAGAAAGRGIGAPIARKRTAQGIQSPKFVPGHGEERAADRGASRSRPHPMSGAQSSAVTTGKSRRMQVCSRTAGSGATGVGPADASVTDGQPPALPTIVSIPIVDREQERGDDRRGSGARRDTFPHRGMAALTITTGIPLPAEAATASGPRHERDSPGSRSNSQDGSSRSRSDGCH